MTGKLTEVLADPAGAVWLDSWDYCRRLFLDGRALEWGNSAEVDGFVRKSESLLKPSVTCVPIGEFLRHAVQSIPGLQNAMGEKSRSGYALKTLLRDETLRARINGALKITAQAVPTKPLAVSVPGPRSLIAWAYEVAHGTPLADVTLDHADSASVYLSDFLTSLAGADLSGILVEEDCAVESDWVEKRTIYTPMSNVAKHRRWALGVRLPFSPQSAGSVAGFDFVISGAKAKNEGPVAGEWLDAGFWNGGTPEISAGFNYSVIPADAVPEKVLERRRSLEAQGRAQP